MAFVISPNLSVILKIKLFGFPVWPFALFAGCKACWSGASFLYRLTRSVTTHLWYFDNYTGLGSWAVVTGASDGIGQAYAEQLARKGMNVMLISRTEDKLIAVAAEIAKDCPNVEVRWITADFSKVDIYDRIERELKDLDVGVLINNVGMTCNEMQYFWETSRQFVWSMINVNIVAMCLMTHIIMPKMAAKNRGLIVNVSSICGELPPYLFVMYGTTKNYMQYFSYGLQLECAKTCPGVVVQDLSPAFVATRMAGLKGKRNLMVPSPSDYVAQCLKTVGIPKTHGHLAHELQWFVAGLLPKFVLHYIPYAITHYHRKHGIRGIRSGPERSNN